LGVQSLNVAVISNDLCHARWCHFFRRFRRRGGLSRSLNIVYAAGGWAFRISGGETSYIAFLRVNI
jgi:hypothetical protein